MTWIRPTLALVALSILCVSLLSRPEAAAVNPPSSTPFLSEILVAEVFPGGEYLQISADWFVPSLGGHKITLHYNSDPLGVGVGWERSFVIAVAGPFPADNPVPNEWLVDPFNYSPVEQQPFDNEEFYDWYTIRTGAVLEAAMFVENVLDAYMAQYPPQMFCLTAFEDDDTRWFRLAAESFLNPPSAPINACEVLDGSCTEVIVPYVKYSPVSCTTLTNMTISQMLAPPAPGGNQHPYTPLYTYPNSNPWSLTPPVPQNQLPGYFYLPSPEDLHPSYYMPNYFFPNYHGVPIRP